MCAWFSFVQADTSVVLYLPSAALLPAPFPCMLSLVTQSSWRNPAPAEGRFELERDLVFLEGLRAKSSEGPSTKGCQTISAYMGLSDSVAPVGQ